MMIMTMAYGLLCNALLLLIFNLVIFRNGEDLQGLAVEGGTPEKVQTKAFKIEH